MNPAEARKICTKCKIEKPISQFNIRTGYVHKEYGTCSNCKVCVAEMWKKYYSENRDKLIERANAYSKSDKARRRQKVYRKENTERIKVQRAEWRSNNVSYTKENYQKNKEHKLQYGKIYRATHKDKVNLWVKARHLREKEKNDPVKRLHSSVSASVRAALMRGQKQAPTFKLLGYSVIDLRNHLELQFINGMSWDNYGREGWHIDHIIPVKAFNFERPTDIDFKRCWELTNLRPLWAEENRRKQDKLYFPFQPSLAMG